MYANGDVCISILHPPGVHVAWHNTLTVILIGNDKWGYEKASERWLPVHTVESILLSVISMLSSPNDESPANIESAKEWRTNKEAFRKRVARCVRKSQVCTHFFSSNLSQEEGM